MGRYFGAEVCKWKCQLVRERGGSRLPPAATPGTHQHSQTDTLNTARVNSHTAICQLDCCHDNDHHTTEPKDTKYESIYLDQIFENLFSLDKDQKSISYRINI